MFGRPQSDDEAETDDSSDFEDAVPDRHVAQVLQELESSDSSEFGDDSGADSVQCVCELPCGQCQTQRLPYCTLQTQAGAYRFQVGDLLSLLAMVRTAK